MKNGTRFFVLFLISGLLGSAVPVAGQEDCRLFGNLVNNCGFVTDLDGWIQDWGTFSLDPEGYASPGSARILAGDTGITAQVAAVRQCVPLADPGRVLRVVAHAQVSIPAHCGFQVVGKENADCIGASTRPTLSVNRQVDDVSVWQRFEGDWQPPDGTVAAQFYFECFNSDPALVAIFDDFYIGPEPRPLVTDVPAMDGFGVAGLVALLAIAGWMILRRTAH